MVMIESMTNCNLHMGKTSNDGNAVDYDNHLDIGINTSRETQAVSPASQRPTGINPCNF